MRPVWLVVLAIGLVRVHAQNTPEAEPRFEVASVKPTPPDYTNKQIQFQRGGRVLYQGISLREIIESAYQLQRDDQRLAGLPDWTRTERFDIDAKAPDGAVVGGIMRIGAPSDGLLMLRTLLADRFRLRMHTEVREAPIFALVNADRNGRLGPKLVRSDLSDTDCERIRADRMAGRSPQAGLFAASVASAPPCIYTGYRNRLVFSDMPLAQLTDILSAYLRRLVVDRTGLTGRFDLDFTWTPDELPPPGTPDRIVVAGVELDLTGGATIDPNGAGLITAVREQLGLRLESTRAPVDVFVVDSIERPTPD
jgi:uncharacterized protein (TIGR03435 family)